MAVAADFHRCFLIPEVRRPAASPTTKLSASMDCAILLQLYYTTMCWLCQGCDARYMPYSAPRDGSEASTVICRPRRWGMARGGGTILRKGSPSSDSAPSFDTLRQGAAPMFGYSALTAFPLRHQGTVRLAVESLACMVRRWMLSHEVGVNSAAKPMGRILVCVKKFACPFCNAAIRDVGKIAPIKIL